MNASLISGWLLIGASFAGFIWRGARLFKPMRSALPAHRFDQPGLRLKGVLRAVGLHERLLKLRYAGVLHAMIFASFIVLSTAILQAFGAALIPGFTLAPVGGDTWIALLQDIFALVVSAAVAMAIWQRLVIRPPRFAGSNATDATIIYGLIAAIVVCMLLQAAFEIVAGSTASVSWRPVSGRIAAGLTSLGVSPIGAAKAASAMFWAHLCAILGFLVYIPGSKHRHMFLAAPNIYFRNLKPKGQLPPAPPKPAKGEAAAATSLLSWKDLLDVYSCTECGRCQAVCPAYAAGLPLSPKLLMMDLRDHVLGTPTGPLVGGSVSEATLWACTTCRACMESCPVHIEHVPKIVAMRRTLIDEGKIAPMLQDALSNLQRTGNSMGIAPKMRARWTRDLPFKIKDARKARVDVLWFVGDFASYDQRAQAATRKVATLLHKAGVDFGILYDGEQNSGNDVRRVGEDGLFEILAHHNIDALAAARFDRIMTTDPHSLNALRQEYPALGAQYEVAHYSQVLVELIEAGRLAVKPNPGEIVTYHDPCYLGRYNGGFDAPRKLIERAGYKLREMGRCRENSFCCGAGGGRIWADDSEMKERPSENRIREALALGDAKHFVVACPKDKVMYTAAVQALGAESRLDVLDLADLIVVEESVAAPTPAMTET
jgi:Fe-S oxidoreductase